MNTLIKLIGKIHQERWCFKFNGGCSTCGMKDVHNEIRKYDSYEIIESFENMYIDDGDTFIEYLTSLQVIYSLITYIYAPEWFKSFDFVQYEKMILEKYKNTNAYAWKTLFSSNATTYWKAWQKRMDEYEWKTKNGINDQQLAKKERQKQKRIDHKQRQEKNRKYRHEIINNLEKMESMERLLYIVKDNKYPVHFYPSYLISDILSDLNCYKQEHLKLLYEKISKSGKISNPQWKQAKSLLHEYLLK